MSSSNCSLRVACWERRPSSVDLLHFLCKKSHSCTQNWRMICQTWQTYLTLKMFLGLCDVGTMSVANVDRRLTKFGITIPVFVPRGGAVRRICMNKQSYQLSCERLWGSVGYGCAQILLHLGGDVLFGYISFSSALDDSKSRCHGGVGSNLLWEISGYSTTGVETVIDPPVRVLPNHVCSP